MLHFHINISYLSLKPANNEHRFCWILSPWFRLHFWKKIKLENLKENKATIFMRCMSTLYRYIEIRYIHCDWEVFAFAMSGSVCSISFSIMIFEQNIIFQFVVIIVLFWEKKWKLQKCSHIVQMFFFQTFSIFYLKSEI